MFERLQKPIFYKILDDIDSKEFKNISFVSKYFNNIIKSEGFLVYQIARVKNNLLIQNPDLNEIDANLAASSLLGLTRFVQKYIDLKANVNVTLIFNRTLVNPIHLAAYSRNLYCVMLLVKNRASFLPAKDMLEFGSPLHFAVAGGSLKCVRYFLDAGIPVDYSTHSYWPRSYWTALELAANLNQPHCCELLIKRGADIHYQDPGDFQPIHRACDAGNSECLRILINHGADVNAYTEDGVTPLHIAVAEGSKHCVSLLLAHGADARIPNHMCHRFLPLHSVIIFDYFEIARILLAHDHTLINCAYNHKYGRGFDMGDKTPLHLAAAWGEVKWLQFFLSYNPDPDIRCPDGKTAIDYATENGHERCVSLLYDYMIEREFVMSTLIL